VRTRTLGWVLCGVAAAGLCLAGGALIGLEVGTGHAPSVGLVVTETATRTQWATVLQPVSNAAATAPAATVMETTTAYWAVPPRTVTGTVTAPPGTVTATQTVTEVRWRRHRHHHHHHHRPAPSLVSSFGR
jgi:hypothetical protein